MSFTQLNPPLPLEVIGKGKGLAIGMIDYGPEHNLIWVTAIDDTGEIWCAPNPKVRLQQNWTMGRSKPVYDNDPLCANEEEFRVAKQH
jgi:hypothetical protein